MVVYFGISFIFAQVLLSACLVAGTSYFTLPMFENTRRSVFESAISAPKTPAAQRHKLVPPNSKISTLGYPDDSTGRLSRAFLEYPEQMLLLSMQKLSSRFTEYSSWVVPISVFFRGFINKRW